MKDQSQQLRMVLPYYQLLLNSLIGENDENRSPKNISSNDSNSSQVEKPTTLASSSREMVENDNGDIDESNLLYPALYNVSIF